jgi:hypothetical protein
LIISISSACAKAGFRDVWDEVGDEEDG